MKYDNRPIGIFDSGLGGLTVLKEVHKLLPGEDIVYFGDSGRAPYGTKSPETVLRYTFQDMNYLLRHNVKMIVIACNTASACSLGTVSRAFKLPVIDVVGAGAKFCAKVSKTGRIGIIGTPATISSGVYEKSIKNIRSDAECFSNACPLFVPLVEEGWWDRDVTKLVVKEYLTSLKEKNIDSLVLGCTHYPYLADVIGEFMGDNVTLVNSAIAVAGEVRATLEENQMTSNREKGSVIYRTSDTVEKFSSLGSIFLGEEMTPVERVEIDREFSDRVSV